MPTVVVGALGLHTGTLVALYRIMERYKLYCQFRDAFLAAHNDLKENITLKKACVNSG